MTAVLTRDQLHDIVEWIAWDLSPEPTGEIHLAMRAAILEAVLEAAGKSQDDGADLLDWLIQAAVLGGFFLGASVEAGNRTRPMHDQTTEAR
jgi:hypothetical protein